MKMTDYKELLKRLESRSELRPSLNEEAARVIRALTRENESLNAVVDDAHKAMNYWEKRFDETQQEFQRVSEEHAACLEELRNIDVALGTNEGHIAVGCSLDRTVERRT